MPRPLSDQTVTIAAAAEHHGVSQRTIHRLIAAGSLVAVRRHGRRVELPARAVADHFAAHPPQRQRDTSSSPIIVAMRRRGMCRRELAALAGISPAFLGKLVRGDERPSARLAEQLARVLETDPAVLFPSVASR